MMQRNQYWFEVEAIAAEVRAQDPDDRVDYLEAALTDLKWGKRSLLVLKYTDHPDALFDQGEVAFDSASDALDRMAFAATFDDVMCAV